MTSSLGIYFGTRVIEIIEAKGKRVLNSIKIPRASLLTGELEDKVPEDVKIVAILKEEFRRHKIEPKDATIAFSGRDLIIRSFEMPIMPMKEMQSAVAFEAKRYIPFKVEDLVSNFQVELDKQNRKNLVLFEGIKKETLEKYISILRQLGIRINSIEYCAFSVLRFLKLSGFSDKDVTGVITLDFHEEGEVNFTVLQDGFPLFSRDIALAGEGGISVHTEAVGSDMTVNPERLKTELRISLDFYRRKFPAKNINKVLLVSGENYRTDMEAFIKELGLPAQFVDASRHLQVAGPFSLSFIKSYGCALFKLNRGKLKINLLASKERIRPPSDAYGLLEKLSLPSLSELKIDYRVLLLGLLICLAPSIFFFYRKLPLERQLQDIINRQPAASTVSLNLGYEQLIAKQAEYNQKIKTVQGITAFYFTEPLDIIPRVIPEGVWFTEFSFRRDDGHVDLTLRGNAHLADSDKEMDAINRFLVNLKESRAFIKYFKEISIVSVEQGLVDKANVTNFTISCRGSV